MQIVAFYTANEIDKALSSTAGAAYAERVKRLEAVREAAEVVWQLMDVGTREGNELFEVDLGMFDELRKALDESRDA